MVRTAIESRSSKLLNGRPPPIATAEQTLPRITRTILAHLRTGHSRILGQYMNRIDLKTRNHCHSCGHLPHDTHHIFDCPSKPTTRTVESLLTVTFETAKHLNMEIDETSQHQQQQAINKFGSHFECIQLKRSPRSAIRLLVDVLVISSMIMENL